MVIFVIRKLILKCVIAYVNFFNGFKKCKFDKQIAKEYLKYLAHWVEL